MYCPAFPSLPFHAYPTCSISIPIGKNEITPQVISGLGQGSEEATSADKEAAFNYTRSRAMDRWPACFYLKLSYLNSLPYSPFLFRFVLLCFFVSANPICSASLYCVVLCCVVLTLLYCTALRWAAEREGEGPAYFSYTMISKIITWLFTLFLNSSLIHTQTSDAGHHQPAVRRFCGAKVSSGS